MKPVSVTASNDKKEKRRGTQIRVEMLQQRTGSSDKHRQNRNRQEVDALWKPRAKSTFDFLRCGRTDVAWALTTRPGLEIKKRDKKGGYHEKKEQNEGMDRK